MITYPSTTAQDPFASQFKQPIIGSKASKKNPPKTGKPSL
jgi:hypothetical protein